MNKSDKILIIIVLVLSSICGFSQDNLTQYNIKSLSENAFLNPGRMPEARVNINLPIISSLSFGYSNSGFAVSDLITPKPGTDSTFFNTANLLTKLDAENLMSLTFNTQLLGVGFRVKQNYYSFNARLRHETNLSYSKDIIDFIANGNNNFLGKQANLSLKLNSTSYAEYALGFTHITKDEKLSYGGHLKILSGITNINTKRANLGIYTDPNTYAITATPDFLINSSAIDTGKNNNSLGIFGQNMGFGIDLGASYKIDDKISISGSVIDLGFINWNSNVSNYQTKSSVNNFTFSGFDINKIGTTLQPFLDTLTDSLKHTFDPVKTTNSYKTGIGTKIYLGANYILAKGLDAGVLLQGKFVNEKLYTAVSFSLNEELSSILNVSASFSRINQTNNVGLGFSLNLVPVQLYFVTDNIFGISKMDDVRNTNLHVGLNLAIGRSKKEIAEKGESK